MSRLNEDILFLIYEKLQNDSKSLFSCLMVNRLWYFFQNYQNFKFSLKALEEFLEKWKGHALSIFTSDSTYVEEDDYVKLINKYKNNGMIKDFRYEEFYEFSYQSFKYLL
ncbi:hypothetical protein RclHR1_35280001 [Rhizophagus clarus]|uniref:F-box domain-containing protein n=1 Tax=Rhizophagus clarus TaxID=94130 RepID=A0A2Z6RBE4_9GLOM|nr:hypothetical protein RclHR1_35280001 [Rhizophagus clarus]